MRVLPAALEPRLVANLRIKAQFCGLMLRSAPRPFTCPATNLPQFAAIDKEMTGACAQKKPGRRSPGSLFVERNAISIWSSRGRLQACREARLSPFAGQAAPCAASRRESAPGGSKRDCGPPVHPRSGPLSRISQCNKLHLFGNLLRPSGDPSHEPREGEAVIMGRTCHGVAVADAFRA